MLENRDQAGVGIRNLVVAGDDDRDPRRVELRERKFPVLAVNVPDCEFAVNQISALRRADKFPVPDRMPDRIEAEQEAFPLAGPLRILRVKDSACLPAEAGIERLVATQIL